MEFNYQNIAKELVIALRRNRTSAEVSRLMGFNFNQVRRWENGEKQLRWDEFCDYCDVLEVPLLNVLQNTHVYPTNDPRGFPGYLHATMYPYLTVEEIAERLHRHPSAIRRYLDGEVFPDLEFMLAFIHLDSMRLPRFVMDILPEDYRSELRSQLEQYLKQVEKIHQSPILAAIRYWLDTAPYKELPAHDDAFIAERVGCSSEEAAFYLSELVKAGCVKKNQNGKFVPLIGSTQIGTSNRRLYRDAQTYWFSQVARYYAGDIATQKGPVGRLGSSRVATATRKQAEKINAILARVDAEIVGVLLEKDDEPVDDVRLVLCGSYSLQDLYAKE